MNFVSVRTLIILIALILASCADESMTANTSVDTSSPTILTELLRARQLDGKTLFLQTYYNNNGDQTFKEPYPYAVNFVANLLQRRRDESAGPGLSISQPPIDCNAEGTTCTEENGVYSCETISTLMSCDYTNDLTDYYRLPASFTLEVQNGYAVFKGVGNNSKAIFKILDSSKELPTYNPPIKIPFISTRIFSND